ncbi:MAG: tripartite tricarboxylate transporter substrate binding protein, partial [Rubrivivax sp.]
LARLRDAARQALASPDVAQRLAGQGLESKVMSPDEAAAFGRVEVAKWADLVRRSGARVD